MAYFRVMILYPAPVGIGGRHFRIVWQSISGYITALIGMRFAPVIRKQPLLLEHMI
jgi:hypothetical protein